MGEFFFCARGEGMWADGGGGNDRYDRKSPQVQEGGEEGEEDEAAPEASSIIRLQNGMVLYLREINK